MYLASQYCSVTILASISAFGRTTRGTFRGTSRSTERQAVVVIKPRAQRIIWCILIVFLLLLQRIDCAGGVNATGAS